MTANSGEYLVKHGVAAHLGRFRAAGLDAVERGVAVVVRGRRGLELGELLCPVRNDGGQLPDEYVGDLLRVATSEDVACDADNRAFGLSVLASAERHAGPLAFVDVEIALDRSSAVLHALRVDEGDANSLLAGLGDEFGVIVRLHELNAPIAEDEHGCGSCGSEGGCGSCGAGGCTSCSSGAGEELAGYFRELRAEMENRNRVALL